MAFAIGLIVFRCATMAIRGIVLWHAATTLHGVIVHCAIMAICGVVFSCAAMAIGGIVIGLTATELHGVIVCHTTLAICIIVFCRANFGNTWRCCLLRCHGFTWQRCLLHRHGDTLCHLWLCCHIDRRCCLWPCHPGDMRQCCLPRHFVIGVAVFCRATSSICGIVICHTTTAMHGEHNNKPKEGCAAKMPATEAKKQKTTSRSNKRIRGWCITNASAMTAMWTMTMAMVTVQTMRTMTTMVAAAASIEGQW
jgi:hypothetical protein